MIDYRATDSGACVIRRVCYQFKVPSVAEYRRLYVLLAVLSAGILFYSQQTTLDWDEGFHLVAASLVAAGKRPYVDFCFPQPLLHAYWNALWLQLTGGGWRGPQAVAAVLTCGAMGMTADFVLRRCGLPAAWVAGLFVGLNAIVVEFGTKAQAYAAGTFLTVAAFRALAGRAGVPRSFAAGILAGAAAACSLLTAPACVVLLLWTAWQRRWKHAAAFVAGAFLPLLTLLVPLLRAPDRTWFNLVQYHVYFRHVGWTDATENDLRVLVSWVDSGQALLLGLFAVAGLICIRKSDWTPAQKGEFYLAAWMAAGLGAEAAVAHPTFPQYFIFVVPFLAMPAAVGFREVVKPAWGAIALAALLGLSLTRSLVDLQESNHTWDEMAALARNVEQVTPAGAQVMADPPVYFALHREPPSGLEFPASNTLELPAAMADALHILPRSRLAARVRAGGFATVETCKGDEDEIEALELPKLYAHSASVGDCQVYWGLK